MKSILRALTLLALAGPALAGNYVGDYNVGDTVDCNFGTVNPSTGASFTLAGTPVISAYIDNSTTELTAGITLTADFDARTGMNHVRVAATGGNGYAAGTFVSLVITTGTVNSISVVGQEVCSFTLRKGTITGIPAATAGAAGGIQIAGSNAATTFATLTVTGNASIGGGLNITQSVANTPALVITGNGTGNGATITGGSGATGTGLAVASGATNGAGLTVTGTGTGNGATFTSGAGATGNGLSAVAASTNGNGINTAGTGTGSGELDTGGATGHGIRAVGGATSGSGISAVASTSGSGIVATGVGTTQPGIAATGGSTSSAGISATGGGTGSGILATSGAGATGNGIQATAASTNGSAIGVTPTGTGLVFSTPANANVTQYGGSAGTFASGRPEVNATSINGSATAGVNLALAFNDTQGESSWTGISRQGTGQAASSTTYTLDASAPFGDNTINGQTLWVKGSTNGNYWQACSVSGFVNSTKVATISCPSGFVTPTGTLSYKLWGVAQGSGSAPTVAQIATGIFQDTTAGDFTVAGSIGKSLFTSGATPGATGGLLIAGTNAATAFADFDVTANASFAGGVTITQSSSNTPALVVTGNGTGNGATFTSGSGATGNGIQATAASTNGSGIGLTATGTGVTMTMTPANAIQIAGQTTSAAGSVAFPTTVASTTNITSATGITVATNSDKTGYTLSSAGINAFADTSTTGHTTGGTWGGAWNAAGAAGDPWSTALPGGYAAGTAGNIIGNRIDAAISSRMATFTLPTNFSSLAVTAGGAVTAGTVSDKTGYSLTQAFPTNFSSLAITGGGAVTAGTVSDKTGYALSATGLNAITLTEPAATPVWGSSTLSQWLAWQAAWSRNKITQTSSTKTMRNDADNANLVTCTVSDNGTTFTLSKCTP